MHEVYVFCGEQGRKHELQLLFCFEENDKTTQFYIEFVNYGTF